MLSKVQRFFIATVTTAAFAVAAGQAQAAKSTITLSIGDESSPLGASSWGASNSGTAHSGGGAGAGKVNIADLSVSKDTDAMTPSLVRAVATGEHLQQVAVQFTNGIFTSSYCLKDAFVTSVSNSATAGAERPVDNVSFSFARFTFKVGTAAFSFNIVENSPDTNPC